MMNSNLNLNTLPECKFAYRMVNSALLIPCIEYQRMLRMEKVSQIAENFSEYIANEPKVSYRDGRFYVFDGQNTVEARRTCNGGKDVTIRCKVFYGLTKEDEAMLFAIQTGNATCLTAGERLRANLVAENPDALYFVGITSNAGVEFAYDGIRAPWKIYCIETAYELYKQYGCERYVEMLRIINEAWKGNVDSYLAGVIRGVAEQVIGGGTFGRLLKRGVAFGAMFPDYVNTMHQANEFADVEDLYRAAAIYAEAIYELIK